MTEEDFRRRAEDFISDIPYKKLPYSGRNWGHEWHSLCSYHGKLKPSIAHFLVKEFTKPGDKILDPLCGVGTIPLEACLQGRYGIGNDLSELAFVVTKAKLEKPDRKLVNEEFEKLSSYILNNVDENWVSKEIKKISDFGFNGKIPSYFHEKTLREIICAKDFLTKDIKGITPQRALILSCILHILHGNRPYALSRRSHPLTPYAPKGDFEYKNVIEHLEAKIDKSYKDGIFDNYTSGKSIFSDCNELQLSDIDAIITSPPFADSIRFYMQNWMRLWFCGWTSTDFKEADKVFLDRRQKNNFDVYIPFFEMCHRVLKKNGIIILHLGKTKNIDMAKELSERAVKYFDIVFQGSECVADIEKHGVKDKGGTIDHQFLFLQKKG